MGEVIKGALFLGSVITAMWFLFKVVEVVMYPVVYPV